MDAYSGEIEVYNYEVTYILQNLEAMLSNKEKDKQKVKTRLQTL